MNKSNIEYCDHTLNIITGCRHDCSYCYARSMSRRFSGNIKQNVRRNEKYRLEAGCYVLDKPFMDESEHQVIYPFGFEPTLHRYRYKTLDKLKMGQNVFVGAMSDMFGDWVPEYWIDDVFRVCMEHPKNNYLFLTKNPERYADLELPDTENMFFGTSITREDEMHLFNLLPAFRHRYVSMEPILEDLKPEKHNILFKQVDWIILGAETGRRKDKVVPQFEWIKKIVVEADYAGVPVFMKDSLIDIVGEKNMRREFPGQLKKREMSDKVKEKLEGVCAVCHGQLKKSDMVTLSARIKRGGKSSSFAYMCKSCFKSWCNSHQLKIPDLEGLQEENDGKEKKL